MENTQLDNVVEMQVGICRGAAGGLLASWTADLENGFDDVIVTVWETLESGENEFDKKGLAVARNTLRRAALNVFGHSLKVEGGKLVKPAERKSKKSAVSIRWNKLDKVLATAKKNASAEQVAAIEAAVKSILAA